MNKADDSSAIAKIKSNFLSWIFLDREYYFILGLFKQLKREGKLGLVCDFACGKGRYLFPLREMGVKAVGFDINQDLLQKLTAAGLEVYHSSELKNSSQKFDCLVLSHIIEHFMPRDLQNLFDEVNTLLKPGGRLIIATPMHSTWFYDDFDHIRPYHPASITQILDSRRRIFEYQTKARFQVERVWIQRRAHRLVHWGALYEDGHIRKIAWIWDFAAAAIFKLSFGWIGAPYTWVGVFKRIS